MIDEIAAEINDESNSERVDDLFSSVANPEFVIKENNPHETSNESKKLNIISIKP